ncbi:hypothetical protein EMCRGX_G003745 [Ephydatia muelleri]
MQTVAATQDSSNTSSGDAGNIEHTTQINLAANCTRVRLPKLELKRFDGELTMWILLWDSFESAVHNSNELSPVDKFNYLKSLLDGPAAAAIAGLTLSTPNYSEGVTILKKRFGNKQLIVTRHMDTLMSLEAVISQHNHKGLRQLYNLMESHIRSLHSWETPETPENLQ